MAYGLVAKHVPPARVERWINLYERPEIDQSFATRDESDVWGVNRTGVLHIVHEEGKLVDVTWEAAS